MGDLLTGLLVCGLLGVIGQGTRAAVALSNSNVFGGNQPNQQSQFNAAYLTISLIIGFIAGVLAGLALGVIQTGSTAAPAPLPDRSTVLGLIAAGYAGTDFIESTFARLMPQIGGGVATDKKPPAAADNATPAVDNAVQSLTGTVQSLSAHIIGLTPRPAAVPAAPAAAAGPDLSAALRAVLPGADIATWLPALSGAFGKYGVNTPLRIAAALGQFVAEAGADLKNLRENMNYSASRLMEVFPHEIPDQATADEYAGKPEMIGNLVYANRQGNGDVASGDGYRFRGGGLIQLTGRDAYEPFAKAVGMDVDQAAAYVGTAEGAAISACWYLSTKGCLPLADQWRLTDLTRAVNGSGLEGLATRIDYANRFRHTFGVPIPGG